MLIWKAWVGPQVAGRSSGSGSLGRGRIGPFRPWGSSHRGGYPGEEQLARGSEQDFLALFLCSEDWLQALHGSGASDGAVKK